MTEPPADRGPTRRQGRQPFDVALRADAVRIPARLTPDAERRIEAQLAGERPLAAPSARRETFARPWLAGSLVGLGVAAAVVLSIGRIGVQEPIPDATPEATVAGRAEVPSDLLRSFRQQVPLNAETAELTAPLEKELEDLRSDLDKARENVERDLALTF